MRLTRGQTCTQHDDIFDHDTLLRHTAGTVQLVIHCKFHDRSCGEELDALCVRHERNKAGSFANCTMHAIPPSFKCLSSVADGL
jgi:hypothetical protein